MGKMKEKLMDEMDRDDIEDMEWEMANRANDDQRDRELMEQLNEQHN